MTEKWQKKMIKKYIGRIKGTCKIEFIFKTFSKNSFLRSISIRYHITTVELLNIWKNEKLF